MPAEGCQGLWHAEVGKHGRDGRTTPRTGPGPRPRPPGTVAAGPGSRWPREPLTPGAAGPGKLRAPPAKGSLGKGRLRGGLGAEAGDEQLEKHQEGVPAGCLVACVHVEHGSTRRDAEGLAYLVQGVMICAVETVDTDDEG